MRLFSYEEIQRMRKDQTVIEHSVINDRWASG